MMKLVECLGDDFMVHKGIISPSDHPKGDNSQASGSFKGKKNANEKTYITKGRNFEMTRNQKVM
jgi:hypothetical protein